MADMPRPNLKIEVRAPGSGIDFKHAVKRVEYWTMILAQCDLGLFGEWNEFQRVKATGCLEEWQYIMYAMCPHHSPMEVGDDPSGRYLQTKCNACGQTKWIKKGTKVIKAGITANTYRPEFGGR